MPGPVRPMVTGCSWSQGAEAELPQGGALAAGARFPEAAALSLEQGQWPWDGGWEASCKRWLLSWAFKQG